MNNELLDTARKFNEAVEATSVIGALKADVSDTRADVLEIKTDVKHIRGVVDRYSGAMVLVGSLVSVAVSLVVALLK